MQRTGRAGPLDPAAPFTAGGRNDGLIDRVRPEEGVDRRRRRPSNPLPTLPTQRTAARRPSSVATIRAAKSSPPSGTNPITTQRTDLAPLDLDPRVRPLARAGTGCRAAWRPRPPGTPGTPARSSARHRRSALDDSTRDVRPARRAGAPSRTPARRSTHGTASGSGRPGGRAGRTRRTSPGGARPAAAARPGAPSRCSRDWRAGKSGAPSGPEHDDLAVQHGAGRQAGERGGQLGVPGRNVALPAVDHANRRRPRRTPTPASRPLDLEQVLSSRIERLAAAREHRLDEPGQGGGGGHRR